ncbi:MAG: phage baseplate assembly protein V [Bacteroidales bacterium]|nr:phage baseplate assembly protein V [Bacteroidales bacterium]
MYAEKDNTTGATQEICKDYIVYQFRVVSEASTKTVHLTLFSRDKLLTLDKFSKVYLNQKLGLNIIEDSLRFTGDKTKRGFLQNCKVEVLKGKDNPSHIDIQRLQFLHYKAGGKKSVEAIQPYRVQYNEDFYRFISRIACQCGEALYFEDGVLTLGPDPAGGETQIAEGDIYRIEYPAVENSQLAVNDYHRNFFKDDAALKETDLQYSDCEAFDEYYDTFNEDTKPDSKGSEFYWPDVANLAIKGVAPAIGIAAASFDAVTAIEKGIKAAKELGSFWGRYSTNSEYVNKKYTENVFTNAGSKTNNYDAVQQKNDKDLCQFADVFSGGQLKHSVLADIRKKEMTAAKQTITVQIITHSCARLKLKLGKRVKLPNDDNIYVVTACRGDFSITQNKDITEIEIVPLQTTLGNKSIFVPPYNKCAEFTPVQPQPAFVSDAEDPRYLGRVRVRYPWQLEGAGSPWVRVLTPFSTANGDCIHFQPHVDDEVMIGYVGGNIERPYVIGSLFGNKKENIHDNLFAANNNTIRVGSQRLDFREGSMNEFISSFLPAWGFVTQFIPGFALNLKTDASSGWHGKTRLTDTYSFWTIEGNTATRAVTIDSAWGKVTISAYTGIDIEAVGDVTIKGNNINIKAQNNVTIESGIALKNARKSKNATGGERTLEILADVLSDFLKLDLSFIRTIWESILPPKEGTLKIKSNRYLMLEAGKDGTAIDNDISNGATHKLFAPKDTSIVGKAVSDLEKIFAAVGYYADNVAQLNASVVAAESKLASIRQSLSNHNFNDLQEIGPIKTALKTGTVESLADFNGMNNANNDNAIYEEGMAPADWITAARELKRALNAHDKAFKKKALAKELAAVNDAIVSKVSDILRDHQNDENAYAITVIDKDAIYQAACRQYISGQNKINSGQDDGNWNTWVDSLQVAAENIKQETSFGMTLLNKAILDSLKTGSDYEPNAYTDSQAMNLAEGRIIMSYDKDVSLVVEQNPVPNNGAAQLKKVSNAISLDVVKNALKKTFAVGEQNPNQNPNENL